MPGKKSNGNSRVKVIVNVVDAFRDMAGMDLALSKKAHPVRVIKTSGAVQFLDLGGRPAPVCLLDVYVAQSVCLGQVHAALDAVARAHRDRDHQMVLEVLKRVLGKRSEALFFDDGRDHIFADLIHVAGLDRGVEGKLRRIRRSKSAVLPPHVFLIKELPVRKHDSILLLFIPDIGYLYDTRKGVHLHYAQYVINTTKKT